MKLTITDGNCTPENPYWVGKIANSDKMDQDFVGLVSKVPYIGKIAGSLIGSQLLRPGDLCVKTKKLTIDNRTGWVTEQKLAIALAAAATGLIVVLIATR